jgi:hypothetical protein
MKFSELVIRSLLRIRWRYVIIVSLFTSKIIAILPESKLASIKLQIRTSVFVSVGNLFFNQQ